MPTYLVLQDDGPVPVITRITWSNPKIINEFWFGDSPKNARAISDVFPDTPAALTELESIISLYQTAKAAKDQAISARLEARNKCARGELE